MSEPVSSNEQKGKAAELFDTSLPEVILEDLKKSIRGQVFTRTNAELEKCSFFEDCSISNKICTLFPSGQSSRLSKAVVLPLDATDISFVLKLCTKYGLYPSIKSGGYGTAGWSINGDIVIDLSKLDDITIEEPLPDGGYVGLKNMQSQGSKGKEKVSGNISDVKNAVENKTLGPITQTPGLSQANTASGTGKRRRSPDIVDNALPTNPLVAKFLSQTYPFRDDLPAPSVRRRLDISWPVLGSLSNPGDQINAASETNNSVSEKPEDDSIANSHDVLREPNIQEEKVEHQSDDVTDTHNLESRDREFVPSSDRAEILETNPAVSVLSELPVVSLNTTSAASTDSQTGALTEAYTHAESRQTSFRIRSEDPFGYLSSGPDLSTSAIQSSYGQQSFYQGPTQLFDVGSTNAFTLGSSSRPLYGSQNTSLSGHALGASSPASSFMSSAATPIHPNAFVTFGSGVKQKDIDLFTASNVLPAIDPNGKACGIAYHIPLAAHPVGSSVMLLGGFGFLSRLHGLSIDSLVEIEMVLADGRIIIVNEKEHPDLWWAVRGAGPAFGVITRYKAIAYPVPVVYAGNLIYNFHPATAVSLVKHFRDCVKGAPRELYANVLFTAGPADKGSLVVVQICFIGSRDKGQEYLQAISSWDGEPCLLNEVSEKSFLHQQDSVAQILRAKRGRQWFIRSALISSLPDDIIHKTVMEFADTPIGCTWFFELAGGAVADATDTCFPKKQREAGFTIAAFHQWEMDDDDPLCVSTAEHWIYETLAPVTVGGLLPAFFGRHEYPERVMASYGENWGRLCEIKEKYDPHGLFRNTFWPLNNEGYPIDASEHEPPSP